MRTEEGKKGKSEGTKDEKSSGEGESILNKICKSTVKIRELLRPDRRYLPNLLLTKLKYLDRVSYKRSIEKFIEEFRAVDKDLYTVVIETLNSLWVGKYEKELAFRRFKIYEKFEKILYSDPRYRDHFLHQFQVFLLGLPIIERHWGIIVESYSKIFGKTADIRIDFSWLLAATFHDIGYLVQQFDEWLNNFFKEFLDVPELPVNLDLGKLLLVRNFQEYLDKLTSLYQAIHKNKRKRRWMYDGPHTLDYEFRRMLTRKFIEERNHGVISSIVLLDLIERSKPAERIYNFKNTIFSQVVMPAALSIALHDQGMLLDENVGKINFSKDPLSFILIYCDTLQDWGRPTSPTSTALFEYAPSLSRFEVEDIKVCATLTYNKIKEISTEADKTTFDLKDEEIKKVFSKLKSSDI